MYDRDWDTAERGFQHTLAEAPNYGPGHQWYAVCLPSRGRFQEAVTEVRRAADVDPQSLVISAVRAWVYYLVRDYDSAVAAAKRTIAVDGTFALVHNYLAKTYCAEGHYAESAGELQKGLASAGTLGLVLAHEGRTDEARAFLRDLQRQESQEYAQAIVHIGLGEKQQAIALLERAADAHFPWTIHYNVEPLLDPLRDEPRFKALLRRIGLPQVAIPSSR